MMRGKYSLSNRLIAFALSLVLVFSILPAMSIQADAASIVEGILSSQTVADPSTMNAWEKTAFNPTNLSTEHAGGIWTDKTVLTQSAAFAQGSLLNGMNIQMNKDNLLVVLSALAANSVVSGSGTTPTDTMFVLDISGSMSATDLRAMVTATNDAIHTLLTANEQSRVGVIVYASEARVLLPLDRYTPVTDKDFANNNVIEYIEYASSSIRTGRVAQTTGGSSGGSNRPGMGGPGGGNNNTQTTYQYMKNSKGNEVTTSISTGGGTYIQGGLWAAWEQFESAGAADGRAPVLVLMSDGAPTFVSNDFDDVPNDAESGNGSSSEEGEGFLSQLTAAYVKAKMAQKYSTDTYKANAYVYTVGLGLSSGGTRVSLAEAVLNTSRPHSDMVALWNSYDALATARDKTMKVPVHNNYYGTSDVIVTYNSLVSGVEQMAYSDKYFSANDASQLAATFTEIVNEISLRSSYNVTRVDGADLNTDGYVTFIDEIGSGMEVKDIEGIIVGEELFTGAKLAQYLIEGAFGSTDESTDLGDNLIWSLKQRMGITDTAVVRDLVRRAYNAGQIAYNAATGAFSNYIGWFSDVNGDYVGFWDYEDPNAVIPQDAAFANLCYGMLGATTHEQTAHASDMMYVVVQVSKPVTNGKILENSPQTVTFRVPASLLPTVTYQIHVELDGDNNVIADTATIAYKAATPIRLVYEVGVHSSVTPENIINFLRPGYKSKDADGNYYLYTNAWNWTPSSGEADYNNPPTKDNELSYVLKDTALNAITYAYFEPSEANEHYYFATDSVVYADTNGTVYTGAARPSGKLYYRHVVYTATDANQTGDVLDAAVTVHYEELSEYALSVAKKAEDGSWYIPKGTLRRATHSHDLDKTENTTNSFYAVRHQLVDAALDGDASHAYEFVYMGNNGRITYSPAQGFTLTKKLADNVTASGERFGFTVTVTGDTDGKVKVNGVETALNNGKLTLSLRADESVTVTGMDVGATYTVVEESIHGFQLSYITASGAVVNGTVATGTVVRNEFHEIIFTNDIEEYGSLLVTKTVAYNKGAVAPATLPEFQVSVKLTGLAGRTVYVGTTAYTVDAEDKISFTIKDGDTVNITGIPAGTTYIVEEVLADGAGNVPAGFAANSGYTAENYRCEGMIVANTTANAALLNAYTPVSAVLNNITVDVSKNVTVKVDGGSVLAGSYPFSFRLMKYDRAGQAWAPVSVSGGAVETTLTITDPAVSGNANTASGVLNLAGLTLDATGSHYFRVEEIIPDSIAAGWTYDRTYHDFEIVVADNGAGQLVITDVNSLQHAAVTENAGAWNVSTRFTNAYASHSTKLTVEAVKTLTNLNTNQQMGLQDGQFEFALYQTGSNWNIEGLTPVDTEKNGAAGKIIFATLTYDFEDITEETTFYYVVKETSRSGNGITVDDAQYRIAVTVDRSGDALVIENVTVQKNNEAAKDVTAAVLAAGNVLNTETITFANTYKAESVTQNLTAEKTLTDLTSGAANAKLNVAGSTYGFLLEAITADAPMPASTSVYAAAGGSIDFGSITFTKAGVYRYRITEQDHQVPGVTKDNAVYVATIVVTDNGSGALEIGSVTYTKDGVNTDQIVFNNTYKAIVPNNGEVVINGTKTLDVDDTFTRKLKAGEFRFLLKNAEGQTIEAVWNDASGSFTFSALKFDTLGTYTYTVVEDHAGETRNGILYSNMVYTVTVTVTDAVKDGVMEINVDYATAAGNVNEIEFVNVYTATSVPVQLTARKYLNGDRELRPDEFSFTLTPTSANAIALGGAQVAKNDANGMVSFDSITYSAVGTYTYTIVENKLDENGNQLTPDADGNIIYKGVTYSLAEYEVIVTVRDNESGSLVATVTTRDTLGNEIPVQFFNSYKAAPITQVIDGDKTLNDLTSAEDKTLQDFEFQFQLQDEAGNPLQTVVDNNAGFAFEAITFEKAGTYVYYVVEIAGDNAAVSYDGAQYRVTVVVTDNKAGQLVVESMTYEKAEGEAYVSAAAIAFTNTYEAKKTSVSFVGEKTMEGGYKLKGDDFTFLLKNGNGAALETVKNDANGRFVFDTIAYTTEGTYTYTIEEEAGNNGLIKYDAAKFFITVTVTDVNGELTKAIEIVKVEGEKQENVTAYGFTNIYTPEDVETTVTVQKVLQNLSDKTMGLDGFVFQLELEGQKTQLTTDATGKAAFRLSFTAADVGKTYTYKLTEVAGAVEGMTYSDKVYEIVIAVTQNDDGELVLNITREGTGDFGFTNIYDPVEDTPPKTGVDFDHTLWTSMLTLSAICMLAVLVLGKKVLLNEE